MWARDPSAAAGQRRLTVVLTNHGAACRIDGYGGVGLYDASGNPVPTMQVRDTAVPPEPVVLAAGAAGISRLQWSVVPGCPEETSGPCRPAPTTLQVIPPDETEPLQVAWTYGPVCSGGRIEQQAYRADGG